MQNDQEIIKRKKQAITGGTASEISPAAELIASNVDLLTEILLSLPASSLIRFKCVSKLWLSIISHSQFPSKHFSRNPRYSISGLYFYIYTKLHSVSLRGRPNLPSISFLDGVGLQNSTTVVGRQNSTKVVDSCNGLLLCDHFDSYLYKHRLFVCNLTTKKYTALPNCPVHAGCAYLAFDPSKSLHYKVIYLSSSFSVPCRIDVYSSHNACWKQFTIQQRHLGPRVFLNGAIHWLSRENSLVRFNVNAEETIVMPNPQTPRILTPDKTKYFGESGGSLILIQSKLHFPLEFRILELDKDYRGWIVKFRVNLRPLIGAFPEMEMEDRRFLKVLHVGKGDKETDFVLVLAIPGRIISYDLKCKTWDVLRDLPKGDLHETPSSIYAYPFIEALFPI